MRLEFLFATFFVQSALGFVVPDFEDSEEWRRTAVGSSSTPAFVQPSPGSDACKKDILVLLDTSNSIGRHHFDSDVKPFLKSLINSPKLNVGPDGTQLAMIIFSNDKNTRKAFGFARRTAQEYQNIFDQDLTWDKVHGDRTMTGDAAKMADEQVFPHDSPLNARKNIADVVLLITDGEPRGRKKGRQLQLALFHTSSMKIRDILIVGVAVGQPSIRNQFNDQILKMATSSSTMFNSNFIDIQKILDRLVDASCTPFKPGDCGCPTIQSMDVYIQPSKTTAEVSWVQPNLKCKNNRKPTFVNTTVSPNIVSPYNFPAGNHDIVYTYTFKGGFDLKCNVKITVKTCTCPSLSPVTAYASSSGSVAVQWVAPVPTCASTLTAIQPNTPSGSTFNTGLHTVNYVYSTVAGFDLACGIDIDVRECFCKNTYANVYMNPGSPDKKRIVNWVEPKPNCSGLNIVRTTIQPANVRPGVRLGVGRHLIHYSHVMSNGLTLNCSASIMIKVVPCQGVDYDPAQQMCCCGKLRDFKLGYRCCGKARYDSTKLKCCPVNFNIVDKSHDCQQE